MTEGTIWRGGPASLALFLVLEGRRQKGLNKRSLLVNGLISAFVGITFARVSKIDECKKRVIERFPDGSVARINSSVINKNRGVDISSDSGQLQTDDQWSSQQNTDMSDSHPLVEETTSSENSTRGLTWREARDRYKAGTLQESKPATDDSGFFTDTGSSPRSNSGKNKYGDSWDTGN
ncbi:uncharacterized protein [Argopecten irradians]|uniref:uncharacterized protein n=1 Tax=Argopecten irradians TaxID=31199 RepID=UPI0037114A48